MALFTVLFRYFRGGTEENAVAPDRNLNPESLDFRHDDYGGVYYFMMS